MSEKRFLWIGEHTIIDNKTGNKYSSLSSCLLLNKLNDENEQLRQSLEHMISKATEISNRNVQLHEQLGSTQFQLRKEKAKTMELQMKIDYLCEKYDYKGDE